MGFEPTTIAWEARLPLHPCDVGRQAAQNQLIVSTFLGDGKIQNGISPTSSGKRDGHLSPLGHSSSHSIRPTIPIWSSRLNIVAQWVR